METNEMKRCNIPELQQIHRLKEEGKTIVFVNGCFDLFHVGHLSLLEFAKTLGDVLVVGVNSDESVKRNKGSIKNVKRPIIDEESRLQLIRALRCVDIAILFVEDNPGKLLQIIKPNTIVKGSDYNGKEVAEMHIIQALNCQLIIYDRIKNFSTTNIINRIRERS